ncbi:glycosyltransferase [Neolewinella aurantiaca]|uniref:Glycosyltransferase n=1 Tax=Neolewinella aurantiaca TaxID=2602767 RepID=A0A5C7FFC3_9BACT|nr:glycosyltransferase [Neolewinella aurantiaca]TXF89523.1 glycosyltransferase [Neolewinella aurantiaca]
MKIAIIGTAYPYRGGLAAFNERLAVELAKNHEVAIFTFTLQYPGFLFPGKSQYTDGPAPEGLKIVRNINSVNPLSWYSAGRQIKREGFDLAIIGFWLPFMGPALGTVGRLTGCPVISVVHNIIPHEPRPGDVAFARYYCGASDGFLSLTDSVAEDLKRFIGDKPSVVSPHPVYDHFGERTARETALGKLDLPTDKEYLLFFGLIRDYKGLDLLLEALGDERFENRNLHLLVAGEFYTERSVYDSIIEKHGLGDRVTIIAQFIPDEEVADYFNAADLLVQPYKTATQSGVTQIAYHFEKPMIVTDVGGLAEMCPDGRVGYVVDPQPAAIADAIVRYFDATDREAMQEMIRKEKRRYDWGTMADAVLQLAADVARRRERG